MHMSKVRAWLAVLLGLTLLATACGGEVTEDAGEDSVATTDDAAGDDTAEDSSDDSSSEDATTTDDAAGDDGSGEATDGDEPNIYVDPRGGIFAEFQAGFDRGDHLFTQLDSYCVAHDAVADRVDTDSGIGADEISIVHIKSREDAVNIGFGIPVGDMNEMFGVRRPHQRRGGGIRGRMLSLETIEVSLLVQPRRRSATLPAFRPLTTSTPPYFNSSGFQARHAVHRRGERDNFISTQGQPDEFMERSGGRLFSLSNINSENLRFAAQDLLASGLLTTDDAVGVAAPDTQVSPNVEEHLARL